MTNSPAVLFANNWVYIKTELNWLDRVLVMAVGRQRRDLKELETLSRSRADRVTHHWWKGIITLDMQPGYDDGRPNNGKVTSDSAPSYQQQLAERIQASQQQSIILGLPELQNRLQLTTFEKNILLLALAPEVNRRFSELYAYLQDDKTTDYPLVDLALKLFCRNDQEWQIARQRLATRSPLRSPLLLNISAGTNRSFLLQPLKLSEKLTNLLLSTTIESQQLNQFCQSFNFAPQKSKAAIEPLAVSSPVAVTPTVGPLPIGDRSELTANLWEQLVLPTHQLSSLDWVTCAAATDSLVILLIGSRGTGKTLIAQTLAQRLQRSLTIVDLSHIATADYPGLIEQWQDRHEEVLLLKSGECWLSRRRTLANSLWSNFLRARKQPASLTIFTTEFTPQLSWRWSQELDQILLISKPNKAARQKLWAQALQNDSFDSSDLNVSQLAQKWKLTGGEIQHLVQDASIYCQQQQNAHLTSEHIVWAFQKNYGRL